MTSRKITAFIAASGAGSAAGSAGLGGHVGQNANVSAIGSANAAGIGNGFKPVIGSPGSFFMSG